MSTIDAEKPEPIGVTHLAIVEMQAARPEDLRRELELVLRVVDDGRA